MAGDNEVTDRTAQAPTAASQSRRRNFATASVRVRTWSFS